MIFLEALYIDLEVLSVIACTEPLACSLMLLLRKTLHIMTTANVISLYCSGMEIGSTTHTRFFLLVFPLRAPIKNKYDFCCSFVFPWNGTTFGSWFFATIFM